MFDSSVVLGLVGLQWVACGSGEFCGRVKFQWGILRPPRRYWGCPR